jgi:hypothetical protein
MHSVPPHSLVLMEEVNVKVLQKKEREKSKSDFQI